MKWKNSLIVAGLVGLSFNLFAQETAPSNWFNLDNDADKTRGVSTERAYKELLKDKQPKKVVIVAIIDSGVDPEHEDLKDVMWVNPKEVAGNGIDDDNNGYVDDIHGWNFIGGKDGNVDHDTYELTRLYKELKEKKRSKKEEKLYQEIRGKFESKQTEMKMGLSSYKMIDDALELLEKHFGKADYTYEDLKGITKESDAKLVKAKEMVGQYLKEQNGAEMRASLKGALDYFGNALNYGLNPDFNPRTIVGDNYSDASEKVYGNSDVYGPDATHGTHVAGIVGAIRGNGVGMDGVANNVRIMSIRTVPNGDERDKDVANAIRYAVDNGADVVNMSFGKAWSYDKKVVDEAVKYAEKKGVLLVHAAGNDNKNTDEEFNFPSKFYGNPYKRGKKVAKNWIEVGALSWKPGESSPAVFSNYGKKTVDVFAPGVDIYATTPESKYESLSGTSMAAPVVAGVAALIKSYYPELTGQQLKQIIEETSVRLNFNVKVPGSTKLVPFSDLSITGGVVNVYEALKKAEAMSK